MADCFTRLINNFLFNCAHPPVAGLETNVVIINRVDINLATSVSTGALISNLALIPGARRGIRIEGIKQINSYNSEIVVSDDSHDRFRHSFSGRIHDLTAATRADIDLMAGSARGFVVVVEKVWKGLNNDSAFVVLGWRNGLFVSEGVENSNENNGSYIFSLSSRDISLEPESPKILRMTNYATTLTAFNNAFLSV